MTALWFLLVAILTQSPANFGKVNVCERVSGDTVASAVGGRLIDTKPVNIEGMTAARCIYGVDIAGKRQNFVVWLSPADDFSGLRDASEPPVKPISGIGHDAYLTYDKQFKRYMLTSTKRGSITIQVTSDQADWAQSISKAVIAKF